MFETKLTWLNKVRLSPMMFALLFISITCQTKEEFLRQTLGMPYFGHTESIHFKAKNQSNHKRYFKYESWKMNHATMFWNKHTFTKCVCDRYFPLPKSQSNNPVTIFLLTIFWRTLNTYLLLLSEFLQIESFVEQYYFGCQLIDCLYKCWNLDTLFWFGLLSEIDVSS